MTKITRNGKHSWLVEGHLTFDTVSKALLAFPEINAPVSVSVTLDLSGVTLGDSAGLSLLVEWIVLANKKGVEIRYVNMPQQLSHLAQVLELDFLNSDNERDAAND